MKKTILFAVLALFGVTTAFAQESINILEFPPDEYIPVFIPPIITDPIYEEFIYDVIDSRTAAITRYYGPAVIIDIPSYIDGMLVTSIKTSNGTNPFEDCDRLISINIPSSVTFIEDGAFFAVGLIEYLPVLNTSLYRVSIRSSLTSINVDNNNSAYASIDGVLFDKNIRTLIRYPQNRSQRTYVIPSSVTSIGYGAFAYCNNLTNITIPSSVTSIGERAFDYCSNLTNITIPSSVTTIGRGAFNGCGNLNSVTLSRRTQVGEGVFSPSMRIIYSD